MMASEDQQQQRWLDGRWSAPFAMILAGPSGCGKTRFILNLVAHLPRGLLKYSGGGSGGGRQKVIYCHSGASDPPKGLFLPHTSVTVHAGMVTGQWLKERTQPRDSALLILDDLAQFINDDTLHLFTVGRHHLNINVVLVMHNVFDRNPLYRTLSLNAQYLVVFKNVRDRSSIKHLARQLYPTASQSLEKAYEDATREPFGYLFIDLTQETPDRLRLKTSVFMERLPGACVVYDLKTP